MSLPWFMIANWPPRSTNTLGPASAKTAFVLISNKPNLSEVGELRTILQLYRHRLGLLLPWTARVSLPDLAETDTVHACCEFGF